MRVVVGVVFEVDGLEEDEDKVEAEVDDLEEDKVEVDDLEEDKVEVGDVGKDEDKVEVSIGMKICVRLRREPAVAFGFGFSLRI